MRSTVHALGPMSLALALLLPACDTPEPSDAGQYELEISLANPLGSRSQLALVGSVFEVEVHPLPGDDGETVSASCIERSPTGVVTLDDEGRYRVDAVGPGSVELTVPASGCPNTAVFEALEPDRWSLLGVEISEASGRWAAPNDGTILDYELSPGPLGSFPDVLGRPLDALLVVADHPFEASPALVRSSDEQELRWRDDLRELVVPAHFEYLRPVSEYSGEAYDHLAGALGAGERFDASFELLGGSVALPRVEAVPLESITSLELLPIYWPVDPGTLEREWGSPAGVLAITRDAEGQRVLGAPIEFSLVHGNLAVQPSNDVLLIDDICRDEPPGPIPRAATVIAELGELRASAELEWVAVPGEQVGMFQDESNCVGQTCHCSSTPAPGESALGLLALLGLGSILRRRPRIDTGPRVV